MESPQLITFTCEHANAYTVQVTTDRLGIEEVVDAFRAFLLGAGWHQDNVNAYLGEPD